MKELAKRIARLLFGNYSLYYIYSSGRVHELNESDKVNLVGSIEPIDQAVVDSNSDPVIREQADYLGAGAQAYACNVNNSVAGICIYWFGERYLKRNFLPLKSSEAKLVQIITAPAFRSRGIATELIVHSHKAMLNKGFSHLYARVWHSNRSSWRAFERAGWSRIALVLEVNPFRREKPIRLRFDIRA